MLSKSLLSLVVIGVLGTVGCRGPQVQVQVEPPPQVLVYSAQPERVANPPETLRSLLLANVHSGCFASPAYAQAMLIVNIACPGAVGSLVLRFDKITSIQILKRGWFYVIHVSHRDSVPDFDWAVMNLDDVQHMADSISAMATMAQRPPAPPKQEAPVMSSSA